MADNKEVPIQSRTFEFLVIPNVFDANNPALAQTKIPVGNMPAGFERFNGLTIAQIALILQVIIKEKVDSHKGASDDSN